MGLFSKDIKTMDDLLLHTLQDIYYAEHQITVSLPKLIEKATNRDLTQGLRAHLEETKKQMSGLIKFSRSWANRRRGPSVRLSTGSSGKPMTSPARSRTSKFWMPRLWRLLRRSNTMKSRVTEH